MDLFWANSQNTVCSRRQLFKKLEERNSSINNAKQRWDNDFWLISPQESQQVKQSTRWDFVKRRITPSDGEVETETTEENNNSRPDASGSEQV